MVKKRFFMLLFILVLVVGVFPATAFADNATRIERVNITITQPTEGESLDCSPSIQAISGVLPVEGADLGTVLWSKVSASGYTTEDSAEWEQVNPASEKIKGGYYYRVCVGVAAKSGYCFSTNASDTTVKVNDQNAIRTEPNLGGSAIVTYYVFHVDGSGHVHCYNPDVWGTDASQHWHECTDANCPDKADSIKDKAKHTFIC